MTAQDRQPLPEGFLLDRYRITRLVASGGFSFVDGHAEVRQGLAQGVAVLLVAQSGQYGQDHTSAPQLHAEVLKQVGVHDLPGAT